jgi:hypothetical protein
VNTGGGTYGGFAGIIISEEAFVPAPEPSTLSLLGLGALGLVRQARKRRNGFASLSA